MKPWFASLALAFAASSARAGLQTSSWINYVDRHLEMVDQYGLKFDAISVFTYDFDANGNLVPARPWVDATIGILRADAAAPGRLLYVTVTNDVESNPPVNFSGDLVDSVLRDPAKRAAHIQQLVALSAKGDGIDIDYEALHARTHDLFTQFIMELRAALPPGKKLSVTAQPKTSDAVGERGQAIDWRAIAPYVDVLRVMIYYYSWGGSAPGPAAGLDQVRAVTGFALSEVPASKLSMTLTEYGFDWPAGGEGQMVSYQQAMAAAQQHGAVPYRDPASLDLRIDYVDASGVAHQMWIDDDVSLEAKVSAIQAAGTSRIDFWSLGSGDPKFLTFMALQTGETLDQTTAPPSLTDPGGGGGTAITGPPAVGASNAPVVAALSPASAPAGGPAFTLTVSGSDFTPDAVVRWNGASRATSYASPTSLTASIPASDLAQPGSVPVTVAEPNGTSNTKTFAVGGGNGGVSPTADPSFVFRGLYAFPNPARKGQSVTIRLQTGMADAVDVHVYDVSGALINSGNPQNAQVVDDGSGPQFTYDYAWDVSGVGSGVYLFSIVARKSGQADVRKIGKVAVVK